MKLFKKVGVSLLALSMALAMFASCSQAEPATDAPAEDGATDAPAAEAASGEEIELNFPCIWVAKDSKAEVFGEMVAAFNEENAGSIKVVIEEQTDYQAARDKQRTQITTGNAPDIMLVDTEGDVIPFSESGELLDLTPYMDEEWAATFNTGVLDTAKIDGKLFVLPIENAYFPIMYNKKLLEQVGYTEFPATYEELFELADALTAAGITPFSQMTGENAYTSMHWYSYAVSAAGGQDAIMDFSNPALVEGADILLKMFDYTTADAIGAGAAVSAGHFLNERTAMFMNGPWFFGRIPTEGTGDLPENVGLAAMPALEGGSGEAGALTTMVQNRFALADQEDQAKEEAAVAFLKYVTDPEWISKLTLSSGAFFTVNTGEIEGLSDLQTDLLALAESAPYLSPTFQQHSTAVIGALPAAIDGLVLGEYTSEEFVAALAAEDE